MSWVTLSACLSDSHINIPAFLSLSKRQLAFIGLSLLFNMSKLSSRMNNKKPPSFCSHHMCPVDSDLHEKDKILYSPVVNKIIFVCICSTSKSSSTLELSWLRWKRGLQTTGLTSTTIPWWHYESLWSTEETLLKKSVTLSTFSRELSRKHTAYISFMIR